MNDGNDQAEWKSSPVTWPSWWQVDLGETGPLGRLLTVRVIQPVTVKLDSSGTIKP
ncbi:hypothetical protein GJB61_01745 [Paenibacillus sp. LC-T2]|uniref:F5/8 type C domain-containing protein n=1 Tax=Paenibacillus monticola TaxID=2666075 RepID=A0A7X2KZY5_9BACL|nr:hypothetical protein [Paenibacillus monticola]MRN51729.1 hypothetical protein [Paenibacillus monticola]